MIIDKKQYFSEFLTFFQLLENKNEKIIISFLKSIPYFLKYITIENINDNKKKFLYLIDFLKNNNDLIRNEFLLIANSFTKYNNLLILLFENCTNFLEYLKNIEMNLNENKNNILKTIIIFLSKISINFQNNDNFLKEILFYLITYLDPDVNDFEGKILLLLLFLILKF
jgi:hypothetical protein